jgi:hypothetical protein
MHQVTIKHNNDIRKCLSKTDKILETTTNIPQ